MSDKRPPTVIYLPSSGGYTGSRIISEVSDFAFRESDISDVPACSPKIVGDSHFVDTALTRMVAWW